MLNVTEIFCSIQGESSMMGYPCIFIRLSECNLRCNYCDTQYSYQPNFIMSVEDILNRIRQYRPIKLVEITGGEPLIQPEVYKLMDELIANNYQVMLETNGSLPVNKVNPAVKKIIDVKTPGSGCGNSFCLDNIKNITDNYEFKFVLSGNEDYEWSKNFIFANKIPEEMVLFAPVFGRIEPRLLVNWIVEDRLNIRFQMQLHKVIWDPNKRGV